MFNQSGQDLPLADQRIRYAVSVRIGVALVLFFTASWCLLQWALTTEQRFMAEGLTRQFLQMEATASAIIAACALLHIVASGLGWAVTVVRMRRQRRIVIVPRTALKHAARHAGVPG